MGRLVRRRTDDESGATLILIAISMVAMLIMAGIVLDLGVVRSDKTNNKSTADFATAAGMRALEGPGGTIRSFQGACGAAQYLVQNSDQMDDLSGQWKTAAGVSVAPFNRNAADCGLGAFRDLACLPDYLADYEATWAWLDATADGGKMAVDIYSGYQLPDPDFTETSSQGSDTGDPLLGNCDHIGVIIGETQPAGFSALAGADELNSTIRSVGRVTVGSQQTEVVALLLLEMVDCQALFTNGNNARVRVRATPVGAPTRPGLIHLNSDARGGGCTGSNRAIEGSLYSGGGPSIIAEGAGPGKPGKIGVRAVVTNPAYAHTPACDDPLVAGCTISPVPIDRGIVTRRPVDERFRLPLQAARSQANTRFGWTSATLPGDYAYVGDCTSLAGTTVTAAGIGAAKVFCDADFSVGPGATVIFDDTIEEVVVKGRVSVQGQLELNNPRGFYVRGTTSTGKNAAGFDVNGGRLLVNHRGAASCAARPGSAAEVNKLFLGGGGLNGGSNAVFRLCQTFVHAMGNGSIPATDGVNPYNNLQNGWVRTGAQSTVDWSAPDATDDPLQPGDARFSNFEDMALWTETSEVSEVGGQGGLTITGIFFLPNANPVKLSGQSSIGQPFNAQFIARKLELRGVTSLEMAPNPNDSIPTPVFEGFTLVR